MALKLVFAFLCAPLAFIAAAPGFPWDGDTSPVKNICRQSCPDIPGFWSYDNFVYVMDHSQWMCQYARDGASPNGLAWEDSLECFYATITEDNEQGNLLRGDGCDGSLRCA